MSSANPEENKVVGPEDPVKEKEISGTKGVQADVSGDIADSDKSVQERLDKAEKEARENYDRFLRAKADFENYKKRMARDNEDYRKFANESLFRALLPIVDNLERAIEALGEKERGVNPIIKGVELTLSEILKVFENFAVKPISALREPFDPTYHQAVMQETSDQHPDNTVVKELQKGYLIYDRLLRPAMVVVSKESKNSGKKKTKERL